MCSHVNCRSSQVRKSECVLCQRAREKLNNESISMHGYVTVLPYLAMHSCGVDRRGVSSFTAGWLSFF